MYGGPPVRNEDGSLTVTINAIPYTDDIHRTNSNIELNSVEKLNLDVAWTNDFRQRVYNYNQSLAISDEDELEETEQE